MISDKMTKALNGQIVKEFYSAYFYISMASYFENQTLPGFAHWMRIQAQEEGCHGMIFFNYVNEQERTAILGSIDAPPYKFKSSADIFAQGLAHEKFVTKSIYGLIDIAMEDHDYTTQRFLDWFVTEQREEETNFTTILGKLHRIKDSSDGLFLLDQELATRVFALPAPLAKQP